MCRDISFHSEIQIVKQDFKDILLASNPGHYPTDMVHVTCEVLPTYPIVVNRKALALANMGWGVINTWIDDPAERQKQRSNMVNARSERIIDDKKSYWYRIRHNRCLIPTTGIYEHQEVKGFKNKVPYHIGLEGRQQFYVPALYQVSQEVDQYTGELNNIATFTMITRAANDKMKWIHNAGENKHRMPLFLTPEMEQAWVLDDLSDDDMDEFFHFEMPSEAIAHHPVYSIRSRKPKPAGIASDAYYDWGKKLPVYGQEPPPEEQTSLF
jgi:putative SOS response-associated peptidase YedK